jgi:hypothetical protein
MKFLKKNPMTWFWITIFLFILELAYFLPMLTLFLYANFCCGDTDPGVDAASLMMSISIPLVLIVEGIVLVSGPIISWISFYQNQENRKVRTTSAIIGAQFVALLGAVIYFLISS